MNRILNENEFLVILMSSYGNLSTKFAVLIAVDYLVDEFILSKIREIVYNLVVSTSFTLGTLVWSPE